MKSIKSIYERRFNYYSKLLTTLSKNLNIIANIRLLVGVITIINIIFLFKLKMNYIIGGISVLCIFLFIYLVVVYNKLENTKKYISILKEINLCGIKRITGEWSNFSEKGNEFKDENHNFSYDLDIFGQASLFQWINSAQTYIGRKTLADMLSNPCKNKENINKRQEAIHELSSKRWWRHRLKAEGMLIMEKCNYSEELFDWAVNSNSFYSNSIVALIIRVLPMFTCASLLFYYLTNNISILIPRVLLIFQVLLTFSDISHKNKELNLVYKYKNNIKVYKKILNHFEKTSFDSEYLNDLKIKLNNGSNFSAAEQLRKLEKLSDSISNRSNLMFYLINIILLWDYQCMVDLENWKNQFGSSIKNYIFILGEIEALSSLATIEHDYPHWTTPIITESPSIFNAKSLGHPLISINQICNDINIEKPSEIILITGSNMSGKSTFLRTIGINLVLAYSGAPVCADYMKCSIVDIYTCMRTSDNIEKSISSFYGELLRIKKIINATKESNQIFFLLDEIFKGTNSQDRHIGAKVLIKQLYNNGAMGLVSTHDLELGDLENESNGNFKNYHFREYYKDNKIYFDYKLRSGISTTTNALYLIKMIGIELDNY
ncbi:MutS-related protein [Tepidibacter hydrothermalis]|uniref:DNA mismatch repair protein n=1 Tax=Tepidibacter hydrothermalis TaxID=3036126 RepID=A0ABY8EFV0_9FIRM|nr:MutS family DNA mismatch repair protein [Tepidibacter hydrothermalis]WFD11827.1 DNA mismatch repair protein [Tepidibacter hydrothermalis]